MPTYEIEERIVSPLFTLPNVSEPPPSDDAA